MSVRSWAEFRVLEVLHDITLLDVRIEPDGACTAYVRVDDLTDCPAITEQRGMSA